MSLSPEEARTRVNQQQTNKPPASIRTAVWLMLIVGFLRVVVAFGGGLEPESDNEATLAALRFVTGLFFELPLFVACAFAVRLRRKWGRIAFVVVTVLAFLLDLWLRFDIYPEYIAMIVLDSVFSRIMSFVIIGLLFTAASSRWFNTSV